MKSALLLVPAACAALASPLYADNVDATDPAELVAVIQDLGYRAMLDKDGVGDPLIRSSAGGVDFNIYFYGCDSGERCSWVLFRAGFDLEEGTTLEHVEAWNEKALFGRAYLDDEHDPWLEMAANLFGGVSRQNFEDTYDWWEVILEDFESYISF